MQDVGQFALAVSFPFPVGLLAVEVLEVHFTPRVHQTGHNDDTARGTGLQFVQEEFGQQEVTWSDLGGNGGRLGAGGGGVGRLRRGERSGGGGGGGQRLGGRGGREIKIGVMRKIRRRRRRRRERSQGGERLGGGGGER